MFIMGLRIKNTIISNERMGRSILNYAKFCVDYGVHFKHLATLKVGSPFPHSEEWGPSSSINGTKFKAPLEHHIEMQSGDVITVEAIGFKFSA
ncbi:MAG: hypothetical protein D3908_12105 [Candidatus Electrothrix sp. AUS4]|nr:hypothetical protein [Candidatus Electrothrix sp. AUS4]